MPRGERKDPVWTKLPVPGVVTARRDSTQTLKLRQKRQEEEEQLKKQRRQAEEAARILARRWKQEDRGEGSAGRRGGEDSDEDDVLRDFDTAGTPQQFHEPAERDLLRSDRDTEPAGVWVVTEECRRPRPPPPRSQKADDEVLERRPPADVAAAFESPIRPEKRKRGVSQHPPLQEPQAEQQLQQQLQPQPPQQSPMLPQPPQQHQQQQRRSPSPTATASGFPQPPLPRREASVATPTPGSTRSRSPTVAKAPSGHHHEPEREGPPAASSKPKKSKGKNALAGVFGLDDSDEERESTARQMELAAAGRRQVFARRAGIAAAGSSGSANPREKEAPKTLDPAEVYMRCSQWKQSCNGKEMPMPEELRRALVEVTGNALGHSSPAPARTH